MHPMIVMVFTSVFFILAKVAPESEPLSLPPGFVPIAVNRHGEVVVNDGKRIHLYEIKQGSYTLTGIRSLPGEDGFHYDIAVSDASIYIQDKYNQTHEFDMNDLRCKSRRSYHGRLRGVIHPDDGLVYQLKQQSQLRGDFIVVHENKRIAMKRPQRPQWMHALSVCKTKQHFIIMEWRRQRLDIFSLKGMACKLHVYVYVRIDGLIFCHQ